MDDQPVTPNSHKIRTYLREHSRQILIAGLVLVVAVTATAAIYLNKEEPKADADYLRVVSIAPQGLASVNSKIFVTFNLPVTAHHMEGFAELSSGPIITEQGATGYQVVFTPRAPFYPGQTVKVTLKSGLPSDAGKRLTEDYVFSFTVKSEGRVINFNYKGFAGKFLSFPTKDGAELTADVGNEVKDPKVKIYKANGPEPLLESLIYASSSYDVGYSLYGLYAEKGVDLNKFKLLREINDITSNNRISFKETTGLYLFQGLDGDQVIRNAWVTLNDTVVHMRQDDQKVVLAAQDARTGQPQSGINLGFYTISDQPEVISRHTLNNIETYSFEYPKRLDLIVGQKGNDIVVIPIGIPNSQAEIAVYGNLEDKHQIFLYTDRPIYKKDDVVKYRGIVRRDRDANYALPASNTKVRVYNWDGLEQTVDVGDGGVFSGEFRTAEVSRQQYQGQQYFYISAEVVSTKKLSSAQGSTYFEISDFKKPDFSLEVELDKAEYMKGDQVKAVVKGTYLEGSPLAGEEVSYTVYNRDFYETEKRVYNSSFKLNNWGGMCGGGFQPWEEYYGEKFFEPKTVKLDYKGSAKIEFDTGDIKSGISQEITIVVEKQDRNKNTIVAAKNGIMHAGLFNIFFRPGAERVKSGENFRAVFYAETSDGQAVILKSFDYSLYEMGYQNNQPTKTVKKTGTVRSNNEGVGVVTDSYESSGYQYLYLEVSGQDGLGNKVSASRYISFYKSEDSYYSLEPVLKITSSANNLTVATKAQLEIESSADLTALVAFERGRVYNPQWLSLKKGANTFEFAVSEAYAPSISPTFSFVHNGIYYIEGMSLNVPALSKVATVEVQLNKDKYAPNENMELTVITKDANNRPVSANVGIGIVDKAIFALRKNATPPLHSSFYFFRNRSINTSSSLTWIQSYGPDGKGGGGGGEADLLKKDVNTLFWATNYRTDSSGRLTLTVPLNDMETTWRILTYASTDATELGQAQADFLVAK